MYLMLAFTSTQQAGVLGHEGYRGEDAQTSCGPHALDTTVLLWRETERSKEHFSCMLSPQDKEHK